VRWLRLGLLAALFFGGCGPIPSPGPPPPVTTTTTTTTTTTLPAAQCVDPTPGPVALMAIKIHIAGPNWTTIDVSPLVGKRVGTGCSRDWDYC